MRSSTIQLETINIEQAGPDVSFNPGMQAKSRKEVGSLLKRLKRLSVGQELYSKPPYASEAISACTGACAGRAGFLTGFAYYELSRQSQENTERVPMYVILLLGTFTLSMVVVVRDAVVQRAFRKVHKEDLNDFISKAKLEGSDGYTSTTYRIFFVAFCMYGSAIAQMMPVYNPVIETDNPTLWHATHWLPYGCILICVFLEVVMMWHMRIARSGRGLAPNFADFGIDFDLQAGKWVHNKEADPNFQASTADITLSSADALGGRALLILGFVQHGLARYVYTQVDKSSAVSFKDADFFKRNSFLNATFWILTTVVCCLMIVAVHTSTYLMISIKSFELPEARELFARRTRFLWKISKVSFKSGLYLLFVAAGLTGWGMTQICDEKVSYYVHKPLDTAKTGFKVTPTIQEKPLIPDGACYADVALWPAAICAIGLCAVLFADIRSGLYHKWVMDGLTDPNEALFSAGVNSDAHHQQQWLPDDVMTNVRNLGNSATIAAGFVIYNIATFDTDVIRGPWTTTDRCQTPYPEANHEMHAASKLCGFTRQYGGLICDSPKPGKCNETLPLACNAQGLTCVGWDAFFGLNLPGRAFLFANWAAFSFGMASALAALTMTHNYEKLGTCVERLRFASALSPYVAAVAYLCYVALISFIAGFGLFGYAKMEPFRVESGAVSLLGLVAILYEYLTINAAFSKAKALPGDAKVVDVGTKWVDQYGRITYQPCYERQTSRLHAMAPRALMFGGFAYNAVSFMFRPGATYSGSYVSCMAACFISALHLTLTDVLVNQKMAALHTEARKEQFVLNIRQTLMRANVMGTGYVLFFLGGFIVMGHIKLWSFEWNEEAQIQNSLDYGWLQLVGGVVAFSLVTWNMKSIGSSAEQVREMACTGLSGFQWKEMITDIDVRANAITFQTGNVFYEILFSAINKNLIWINYLYFGFSVLTLVFGTISISCASQLSYWMNDLQTDTKKSYFAFRFRHYESMLFASFLGSVYCWALSLMCSSAVKYETRWYFSFSWAALGLVLMTWSIWWIDRTAAQFRSVTLSDPFQAQKEAVVTHLQRIWRRKRKLRSKQESGATLLRTAEADAESTRELRRMMSELSQKQSRVRNEMMKHVKQYKKQTKALEYQYTALQQFASHGKASLTKPLDIPCELAGHGGNHHNGDGAEL